MQSTLESDIRDVEAIRDRLRGMYAIPKDPNGLIVRSFRAVRLLNYIRLGGGFTLGSLPDMGRHAMRHGMGRVMRTLIKPLMTEGKNFKLAREEVKLAGTALDWVLDTRAMAWADVGDDFGRNSKLERGAQYLGDKFGVVNLMSVWNATMKQWFGVMSQTRMLEAAEAIANQDGSRKELAYLAQLGIDEQMAYRIAEMATEHGDGFDVRWANTEAWQDREAVNAFRAAIVKDVDIGIVTPGQEKPLWMSTEFGKVIGQFRSFTVASMARVAARGLQQRDAATLQGLIMSVGLGMLVYRLKVPDEHIKWDDPAVWIKEGVDRAGVTGWIGEANNILEKWTANSVGISPLLGQEPTSRFDSRGAAGAVLGPSFGLAFDDPRQLAISMARGQWSAKDTHLLRKLLPYQNVFYLRWLFDHLEDDANDAFDIPDRRKAAKTNE